MKQKQLQITDGVQIGSWEEVKGIELSTITKRDTDTALLDGLVVKGYETKFGKTNGNGEQYAPGCLDEFIQSYFVDNGLNMVVDVQHGWGVDDQVGRVIYLETNTTGFYFVAYIPRTVARFEQIRDLLREGILQGFSKMGWASDYEWRKDKEGNDYVLIKKMEIISVSLVTSPANAIPFEAMGETVRNRLEYRNNYKHKKTILKSKQNPS